jgi:lipid-binding SYLF domain-containing protein
MVAMRDVKSLIGGIAMQQIETATQRRLMRRDMLTLLLGAALMPAYVHSAEAATAAKIDKDANAALKRLQAHNPKVKKLLEQALAVLIFPKIIKGGLIIGGQYGEGALHEKGKTVGYYSIAAASFGLQAGGQAFSYALLFMKQDALDYLHKSDGWAVGSGPSVVVWDKGTAESMTSTTITQDVVAIPFGQSGLMAGIGLEGSKITPIHPS